ncbi:hypothetical protein BS78_03G060900 [Paspalum vaginatum]|nr:hypothetical protein BS78_03G060900 [Paspalum vaginatum]
MKLLVDTKAGRVLYAEAGKDVVDFLFSLLTLPVGTVVKILSKDAMVGSIGNLYGSVEKLDSAYVRSADAKNALLSPTGERGKKLLQLPGPAAATAAAMHVYQCSKGGDDSCYSFVAVVMGTACRHCGGEMDEPIEVVGSGLSALDDGMGFVKEAVTYTIMDDLKVAPGRDGSGGVQRGFGDSKSVAAVEDRADGCLPSEERTEAGCRYTF